MPRTLLALLLLPPLAVAAPVPKPAPKKVEDLYGQVPEVSGVTCELTKDEELRISVSKDAPSGNRDDLARPLVTRTLEGDFELTIRLTHKPAKAADLAVGTGAATVSAGVALFADGDTKKTLCLLHKHVKSGEQWTSRLSMNSRHAKGGSGTGRQSKGLEDQPLYLKLIRTGDVFTSQTSPDGKKWSPFGKHTVADFGGAVVVGPVAFHNTTAEYEVIFDQYEVKPLKEQEKKEEKK